MPQDDSEFSRANNPPGQLNEFRFPPQSDREYGLIKDAHQRYLVRLANHSAEGLSVAYSGDVTFQEGQVLQLHTKRGHGQVKIVWIIGGEKDTLLGLQPTSYSKDTASAEHSFSNAALLALVACCFLLAGCHFFGYDASWIADTFSFASRLRDFVVP